MARNEDTKTRRSGEKQESDTIFGTAGVPSLDPLFQASNRMLEAWLAVGNELMEFSKARFDRGIEMSRAMARSKTLNEAMDLQASFTRSAVADYLNEAGKLADLGTRSMLDSFSTLQRSTGEATRHAEAAE